VFDLSICKCGHGWPLASFLPIFSFLCRSVLDLGSCTGQTDRPTDRRTDIQRPSIHNAYTLRRRRHNTYVGIERRIDPTTTPVISEKCGHYFIVYSNEQCQIFTAQSEFCRYFIAWRDYMHHIILPQRWHVKRSNVALRPSMHTAFLAVARTSDSFPRWQLQNFIQIIIIIFYILTISIWEFCQSVSQSVCLSVCHTLWKSNGCRPTSNFFITWQAHHSSFPSRIGVTKFRQ